MSDDTGDATPQTQPVLRVVRGDPTPQELAALIAVVSARNAARRPKAPPRRSEWGHPARAQRTRLRVGPDQWRRSAWAGGSWA